MCVSAFLLLVCLLIVCRHTWLISLKWQL